MLKMQNASEKAKRTIAVLSPNYLNADFTQSEWAAAFSRDPQGAKGLLKNNFRLPIFLKNWDTRSKSIVPRGTYLGMFNVELLHLLIGNLQAFGILSFQQTGSHGQSRLSRGATNVVEQPVG
jgi:hypothetical protein